MQILALLFGIALVGMVLIDAFETIVLPRTVRRTIRLTSAYFWIMSLAYTSLGRMKRCRRRQTLLNGFAPLMLLGLIGLWAIAIICGFACIYWGSGSSLDITHRLSPAGAYLYFSGVTFFTLGFGDVLPSNGIGRVLAVSEAGLGLGFLALIIAYIPVIYAAFSRREVQMLLLDSKAGSDPTAAELLRRHAAADAMPALVTLLKEWERFSSELLESYLSYPVLAYYRSQHDNQSWVCSLTAIMDACALIDAGIEGKADWVGPLRFQSNATFTMARHVMVDLAYILDAAPVPPSPERLTVAMLQSMKAQLKQNGLAICVTEAAEIRLQELRDLYEPFVNGLSIELAMDLPEWIASEHIKDNWETTAWDGAKHF